MRAILFDLDGVFYVGDQLIEGALEALQWCENQAIPYLFITNTTSRPPQAIVEKLAGFGIHTPVDRIISPPVAAVQYLQTHQLHTVAVYAAAQTRSLFDMFTVAQGDAAVDAVVVGDMGEEWSYAVMNQVLRQLMHKPAPLLLALGMTRYWQADDGLRLDAGAFVAAFAYASGLEPLVLGKPARAFFDAALDRLGAEANATLMIGDDIRSDIGAAQQAGLRGALVRTGKFRDTDLRADIVPDVVLDSIADLPDWWQQQVSGR